MANFLRLVGDANGVFDIDLYGNAGAGFVVKFTHSTNFFENVAAEMFFNQQQDNIRLQKVYTD